MPNSTRRLFVAGNWKMFTNATEAASLIKALKVKVLNIKKVDMAVCPPFTNLATVAELLKGSTIKLGAQNLFWEEKGAYTGEISADMLLGVGCECVIIGHSERRQYFGETDETVNRRLQRALAAGLQPIVCIGESLAQRQAGDMQKVVASQVRGAFQNISAENFARVVLAYEPVWAIGTGRTATVGQADEAHRFIRERLRDQFGDGAEDIRIQYGGSVKPDNAEQLMDCEDVDGALVGGASLSAESFVAIVRCAR